MVTVPNINQFSQPAKRVATTQMSNPIGDTIKATKFVELTDQHATDNSRDTQCEAENQVPG